MPKDLNDSASDLEAPLLGGGTPRSAATPVLLDTVDDHLSVTG